MFWKWFGRHIIESVSVLVVYIYLCFALFPTLFLLTQTFLKWMLDFLFHSWFENWTPAGASKYLGLLQSPLTPDPDLNASFTLFHSWQSQILAGVTRFQCHELYGGSVLVGLHFNFSPCRCLSFQFQMARTGQPLLPAVSLEVQVKQNILLVSFFLKRISFFSLLSVYKQKHMKNFLFRPVTSSLYWNVLTSV